MIYFTSDQHFWQSGRKSVLRVGARVFDTQEKRNAFLIQQWNAVVQPEDQVYLLGDFSDGTGMQTNCVLRSLNGVKYLVCGNNDHYLDDPQFDASLYQGVQSYMELHEMETKFVLFHFPIDIVIG